MEEEKEEGCGCFSTEQLEILRAKAEQERRWIVRKAKAVEALVVWATVGIASGVVAAIGGAVRWVINNWEKLR